MLQIMWNNCDDSVKLLCDTADIKLMYRKCAELLFQIFDHDSLSTIIGKEFGDFDV